MLRLGLRLTLRSGREALVRLGVTIIAVAIGVTVLLAVLAEFHGFQATSKRPSWESTQGTGMVAGQAPANATLWDYSENIYQGRFIEQLEVAVLGPQAPTVPGIPHLPGPGQYYASPAMASLLATTPMSQLGDRFTAVSGSMGTQVGIIGDAGLASPQSLTIILGYTPAQLAAVPGGAQEVTHINTTAQTEGTTSIYRMTFGLAAIALLFPLLILINTATRLAASRREERYAALRLVGATPRQVGVIASVDTIAGALLGALVGCGIFAAVRPAIARIGLSGSSFFPSSVTPGAWGYLGMIVVVPIAAAVAAQVTLARVQISPLGVSRKVTRPAPGIWRIFPLLVGIPVFLYPVVSQSGKFLGNGNGNNARPDTSVVFIGFILIMVGLVVGGSWLTMQVARLFAKAAHGGSSLLAARRLADKPKASFRTVSGLILAVFIGTMIAVLSPALNALQSPTGDASLTNVLRASVASPGPKEDGTFDAGLSPGDGAALTASLQAIQGVQVIPIYTNPAFVTFQDSQITNGPNGPQLNITPGSRGDGGQPQGQAGPPDDSMLSCASLEELPVLGTCAPGQHAVTANLSNILFTDNPLFVTTNLPAVTQSSPAAATVAGASISALLVRTASQAELEKARTVLTRYYESVGASNQDLTSWQMGQNEAETFGEVAAIRNDDDSNVELVILAILALTLLIAGCSLAVTIGGSLVERKRAFTLLRLTGTPTSSLRKVVLLESALPLVTATLVAAAVGFGVTTPLIKSLLPELVHTVFPGPVYYITLGSGLVVSLLVVMATLPLLSRITSPANAHFE